MKIRLLSMLASVLLVSGVLMITYGVVHESYSALRAIGCVVLGVTTWLIIDTARRP